MAKSVRFIIGSTNVGGAEKQLAMIIPGLIARGWDVRLVTLSSIDGDFARVFITQHINLIKPNLFKFSKGIVGLVYKFFSILTHLYTEFRGNPSITTVFMMSHSVLFGITASLLALDKGRKIISKRNTIDRQYALFSRVYEKILYKTADDFVVNSCELADQLVKDDKVPQSKVHIVNNAMDFNQFNSLVDLRSIREKLSLNENTKVLLTVARLADFKGHDETLKALHIAKQELSVLTSDNWVFLFAGDGPERKRLEGEVEMLDLKRHMRFLGSYQNINELLAVCDVFVFPSHAEGMPNAVIEAMYMGCEIIGTDIPCMNELTQGLYKLVPVNAPNELAAAIIDSVKNPNKKSGIKAKAFIEKTFSIDNAVNGWERVLLR